MINMAVFSSHNGSNLQSIIDACKNKILDMRVSVVISNNSNSFALKRAKEEGIPCFHISSKKYTNSNELDSRILILLKEYNIEMIMLAGYMKKLGEKVLQRYKGRILNIHPALLPKYGGKGMYGEYVHQAVLKSGEKITGVTIHLVDEEYDTGSIINQCKIDVKNNDTVESLAKRVQKKEKSFLIETLKLISEGTIKLEV